jgi:hypothetical protein
MTVRSKSVWSERPGRVYGIRRVFGVGRSGVGGGVSGPSELTLHNGDGWIIPGNDTSARALGPRHHEDCPSGLVPACSNRDTAKNYDGGGVGWGGCTPCSGEKWCGVV